MNEFETIYQQEMRRRKILDEMTQKAMQPGGVYNVSGRTVPYSPIEGLSQLGQAYFLRKQREASDNRIEEARTRQEDKSRSAAKRVIDVLQGRNPYEMSDMESFEGETIPGLYTQGEPDPKTAMLMAASDPDLQNTALSKVISAMSNRGEYYMPREIVMPDGTIRYQTFDTRRGTWNEAQGPISPKTPESQAAVTKAKKTGEYESKREFNMLGIGDTIDTAREIIQNESPTDSGAGAAKDWAARQVGITTPGAQAAAKLEAIGGALVSKMPRMEGPQSDRDVEVYRQMAARVGDRTVPVAERLAALKEVERLWRKYEKSPNAGTEPPIEVPVQKWNDDKEKRYQEYKRRMMK